MSNPIVLEDLLKDCIGARKRKIREIGLKINQLNVELKCNDDEAYRLQEVLDSIERGSCVIRTESLCSKVKENIIDPTNEEYGKYEVDDAKGLVKVEPKKKALTVISLYGFLDSYGALDRFKENCKRENQKFEHEQYFYDTGEFKDNLRGLDRCEWIEASFELKHSIVHNIEKINEDWKEVCKTCKGDDYQFMVE